MPPSSMPSTSVPSTPSDASELAELAAWDCSHYWHAFTQMAEYEPLMIQSADGMWLIDDQGRRLLDGCSSMWCIVHGHRHPVIDQAIRDQLDQVAQVTSLGMSNPTTVRLARKLVEVSPAGLETVFFSSDGSSAVEVALKMAFQYWRQRESPEPNRNLFLASSNAYHGDTLGSVSVGGVSRFHAMFNPLLFDVLRGPCPDTYRLPQGVAAEYACAHYLAEYRDLIVRFSDRLAAVVMEPLVQGAAGMVMHPEGFLRGIRDLTSEFGIPLIVDEIATGMGRTGKLWACEWEDVAPDFLCAGKGLSGGYLPVAATLATREIWNAFLGKYEDSRSFFHGHTFGGNPLGCAAALAALEVFEQENTLDHVAKVADHLQQRLQEFLQYACVGSVRSRGLVAVIELVQDRATKTGFPWSARRGYQVCEVAMQHEVWLRPLGNSIIIMPPLCVKPQHVDRIVEAVHAGLRDLVDGL